jgi:hypothetical protein
MAGHCIDETRAQEDKKRLLLERFQLEVRCSLQPYGMYAHTHTCAYMPIQCHGRCQWQCHGQQISSTSPVKDDVCVCNCSTQEWTSLALK